jgi:D-lactate dehydrogenase (cytochrome)
VRAGRPVVKNVAGYDMPKVFVGSYGTLGLIADVTLKLLPQPRARQTLAIGCESFEAALAVADAMAQLCLNASALLLTTRMPWGGPSLHPYKIYYTVDGTHGEVEAELAEAAAAARVAGADSAARLDQLDGSQLWADWLASASNPLRLGVAPRTLPAVLMRLHDERVLQAHADFVADVASGMLYLPDAVDIHALQQIATAAGGYATAIGAAAGDQQAYVPSAHDLMRRLQHHWGAKGLLNPGALPFSSGEPAASS